MAPIVPGMIGVTAAILPLAYLVNSVLNVGKEGANRAVGIALTLMISIFFIVAVKYAQLFFPPRTVTLNYITAQSLVSYRPLVTRR